MEPREAEETTTTITITITTSTYDDDDDDDDDDDISTIMASRVVIEPTSSNSIDLLRRGYIDDRQVSSSHRGLQSR